MLRSVRRYSLCVAGNEGCARAREGARSINETERESLQREEERTDFARNDRRSVTVDRDRPLPPNRERERERERIVKQKAKEETICGSQLD